MLEAHATLCFHVMAKFEVAHCFFFPVRNTYSTALLVGEKAAAIIAEELEVTIK
jgi:hypothetical protein